ncbi:1,2-phenylacetyl-CoA epoxidase subunit PaaC [Bacillus benzoevorans]|uniref:Ring-1,2-phenylacetyl-CoA epoxidase subunit PaaC n=1 Tax=Bacillus benzoevorans TaxID=1456 RepID=A0A7X0HMM5_9BACI|nr:1,2-phenylacetyl-CoA epoxidase subunit PaaC [Bacillus benzoevorans]MBB6443610.1 ring-1,2-phenylacetyl-CoA epoxidase subunit PaaC [Bacillus benzoevorans]
MSEAAVKVVNSDVIENPANKEALIQLLFQLADDEFLYSYRGSEWLGLAPHIEEDVAFSSISQDSMGHAALYYQLLENLSAGKADDLAHGRPAQERKNCILVERVNGPGYYMEDPDYDWAYAVVRNYLYSLAKKVKIQSLKQSSYQPLADAAVKVDTELFYHLMHWKTWFVQLFSSTEKAKEHMNAAFIKVMNDFHDVFSFGEYNEKIQECGFIDAESVLKAKWEELLVPVLESLGLILPQAASGVVMNGRNGEHTKELEEALSVLSEVYNTDPNVPW